MDEPATVGPVATMQLEETMFELKGRLLYYHRDAQYAAGSACQ